MDKRLYYLRPQRVALLLPFSGLTAHIAPSSKKGHVEVWAGGVQVMLLYSEWNPVDGDPAGYVCVLGGMLKVHSYPKKAPEKESSRTAPAASMDYLLDRWVGEGREELLIGNLNALRQVYRDPKQAPASVEMLRKVASYLRSRGWIVNWNSTSGTCFSR